MESRKRCIYLDQFAVSSIVDSEKGSLWSEIKSKIEILHKDGKIFCPLSTEHYIETSGKRINSATENDRFLRAISDGYCIKPELFLTSQLISSKIRKYNITPKTYLYHNQSKGIDSTNLPKISKVSEEFNDLVSNPLKISNAVREAIRPQNLDIKTRDKFINTTKIVVVKKFIDRLEQLMKLGHLFIKGDGIGSKVIPNWIDLIIHRLLNTHKLNKQEIKLLLQEFEKHGFDNISTLDIRSSLTGIIATLSKSENRNDQIDVMRAATGLAVSDIFLADKARKFEITELKLHEKYNTKVFSGTDTDLKELLLALKRF